MTEVSMAETSMTSHDGLDVTRALAAGGFITEADVIVAHRIARVVSGDGLRDAWGKSSASLNDWPTGLLALTLRAVQDGSTALDLRTLAHLRPLQDPDELDASDQSVNTAATDAPLAPDTTLSSVLPVPELERCLGLLSGSALLAQGVLVLHGPLLYLDRYYRDETLIVDQVRHRESAALTPIDADGAARALADAADGTSQFTTNTLALDPTQRNAVDAVLTHGISVLTGGPGMGKTYTLSAVLVALYGGLGEQARIALAAPTGKAAARMTQALKENGIRHSSDALTLHRLLGFVPGNHTRFKHNRFNPLPHDVVIVDEASMVSLSMLARLVEALKPSARLLLVGDPDQLASVDAGCVLGDLITGLPAAQVIRLTTNHRLAGARVELADAFRAGDADAVLATLGSSTSRRDGGGVRLIETDAPSLDMLEPLVEWAVRLHEVAATGDSDAAIEVLDQARLLCAHRTGPYGVSRWNRLLEQALFARLPHLAHQRMYVGRPIMVTKNDRSLGLFNGDTGVIVVRDGALIAAMATARGVQEFSPWRLADLETMHAMTIHKSQGSQARQVTVIVPPLDSRLLTRELLYTAATRSSAELTMIGSSQAVRAGVTTQVQRASGLGHRLVHRGDSPAAAPVMKPPSTIGTYQTNVTSPADGHNELRQP